MQIAVVPGDFIFWLVIAFAALVQWLFKKAARAPRSPLQPASPPAPATTTRPDRETDTERMRKFLEALGVPPGATPPPVSRKTINPPAQAQPGKAERRRRSVWENPLPPLTTAPPAEPARQPKKRVFLPARPIPEAVKAMASRPARELHGTSVSPLPAQPASTSGSGDALDVGELRGALYSADTLRKIFVAREILGPPRGLQSDW
jgi:hypothetical protein